MREQPWNQRRGSHYHYQWYRNLLELHTLTNRWLEALHIDPKGRAHQIKRVTAPQLHDMIEILEHITLRSVKPDLKIFLNDKDPSELLAQLDHTVWIIQSWTYMNLLERTPQKEKDAVRNILEQASWKAGRQSAHDLWGEADDELKKNLRGILLTFQEGPLSGAPKKKGYLIKRVIENELQLELLHCPHQIPYYEVRPVADELCDLHCHWTRGFAYALNTQIVIDYKPLDRTQETGYPQYCHLHWSLKKKTKHLTETLPSFNF
tara:strand:+ start:3372 stop:4160 length:789 start_codon:yes stop_codon:yes gene_type:complete